MKKQIPVNGLVYLICMISACLLNLLVSALAVRILEVFIEPSFYAVAIVRIIAGVAMSCFILGAVLWYEGYKSVSFSLSTVLLSVSLAAAVHFVLALVFKFHPFIACGTRYLGGFIEMGGDFVSYEGVGDVRLWAYIVAFAVLKILELIVAPICAYVGMRARLKSRETIDGYKKSSDITDD